MEHFGEYLRAQREKKGIRLEEIASITKIHLHSLELLEESRWDELPPEPFLRGFIIAYAKYIGLDPKETLGKYLEMMSLNSRPAEDGAKSGQAAKGSPSRDAEPIEDSESPSDLIENTPAPSSRKIAVIALAVIAVIAVVGFNLFGRYSLLHPGSLLEADRSADKTPPLPSTPAVRDTATLTATHPTPASPPMQSSAQAPPPALDVAKEKAPPENGQTIAAAQEQASAPSSPPSAPEASHPGAEAKQEVVVEVKNKSWVKVVIDDKPPVQTILEEGAKETYTADTKIKLVLGNSSGATVLHNGEPSAGVKYDGTIRFYVFPPTARFPQDKRHAKKEPASSNEDEPKED